VLDLEKQLADQTVMNQRICSEFKRKSNEILRTIRSLIGFKVYFDDEGQVKLVSGNNTDNFLIFRVLVRNLNKKYMLLQLPYIIFLILKRSTKILA
jgi:hypothetical protein